MKTLVPLFLSLFLMACVTTNSSTEVLKALWEQGCDIKSFSQSARFQSVKVECQPISSRSEYE